jgi:hypothetical protein
MTNDTSKVTSNLDAPTRGLTISEFARRYRVGKLKVRSWIQSGQLRAINTADVKCGKPRYVIPPEALVEFERARSAAAPATKRTKRRPEVPDFFSDR